MKVDIPSGGDIDGCLKQDIIDSFKADLKKPVSMRDLFQNISAEKGLMVLAYEEAHLDGEHCKEYFLNKPQAKDAEEFRWQNEEYWKARDRAYRSYQQYVSDKMLRAEKLPMSKLRRMYSVRHHQLKVAHPGTSLAVFIKEGA